MANNYRRDVTEPAAAAAGTSAGTAATGTTGATAAASGMNYQSPYASQISTLQGQIANRQPFSYNINGDALYQQYRDQYQNLGRQAMQHTMGQAAGLTGGYGSSYSQAAGQQQYNAYLQQLNDIVPQLQENAYNRYNQQTQDLYNQLSMYQNADDSEWSRYATQWSANQSLAQTQVEGYLSAGQMPPADLIAASGYSQEYIQMMYDRQQAAAAAAGSGGGGSTSASSLIGQAVSQGYQPQQIVNALMSTGMTLAEAQAAVSAYGASHATGSTSASGASSGATSGTSSSGRQSTTASSASAGTSGTSSGASGRTTVIRPSSTGGYTIIRR